MPTPDTLHKDISAGRFKSAYYFFGEEDYRIAEAEKYVALQFIPNLQLSTNLYKIDARRTNARDLMTELSSFPMLGEKQVFIVRDFQSYSPTEVGQILKLLTPPDPNRIVIFSSPSERTPRKRSAFFTSISKAAEAIEFGKLPYDKTVNFIRSRLQKEGLSIEEEAVKLLTELLGGSRGGLEVELAKLTNFKDTGETVTVADIKSICAGYGVFGIFELADAVIAGDARMVFAMVRRLLSEGNSPVTLITLMQQHFISVYLVKNGKSPLGNRGFLVHKMRGQAQKYDNSRLEEIIIEIADADKQLRHKGIKPETTLEILVMKLVGENQA